MVGQGMSCAAVAKWFEQDQRTVERWIKRFNLRGLDGLREGEHPGRPTRLTEAQWADVGVALRTAPRELGYNQNLWDGKLLSHHLAERHNVTLSVRECQRVFHRLEFRKRKPRPVIAKGDPVAQAAYKKMISWAHSGKIDLWSLDECHFEQHGTRCTMWVPPEDKDPIVYQAPTRKSVALFGAVNIQSGRLITMFAPVFDAETFEVFLRMLSRHLSRSQPATLMADNARYHHAEVLEPFLHCHRKRFSLDFLPPYSPKLNPIERVWKFLRKKATHNVYFATLEELVDKISREAIELSKPNQALQSLCRIH
jgi:transposase